METPSNGLVHRTFCPKCDREFLGSTKAGSLERTKKHVANAHPEYDQDWAEA